MKKVIVTGAASMMGLALIEECLKREIEVTAVIRRDSPRNDRLPESSLLSRVYCSLDDMESLPEKVSGGYDAFYHFAWGNTGANRNASTELQSRNIGFTLEALKAAAAMGCRRFIGAGSQAEYGPRPEEKIGPETRTEPVTPYGVSKLAAGRLCMLLADELGIECIWPRIFSVYGLYEKETTMVQSSLRKMLRGEPTEFTPARQQWDYLYSRDAGKAYYLIGEKGKDRAVYCVGSGSARPLYDYIEVMARAAGTEPEGIGARPYPPGAVMNLKADISSLKADTGFEPEFTFEEGIRETIEWIRKQERADRI